MIIDSKLPTVGTTIFTLMSQMANDHGAINLSQGFPDFDPPEDLLAMCNKYLRGGYNQYPPMSGVPYLKEQVSIKVRKSLGEINGTMIVCHLGHKCKYSGPNCG